MNDITPKTLSLLTALQPRFRKKMGEWQEGDWAIDREGNMTYFIQGLSEPVDWNDMLRLPLPSPLPGQEVGRTLQGMLAPFTMDYCGDIFFFHGAVELEDSDSYRLLLKAMAAQEGGKV